MEKANNLNWKILTWPKLISFSYHHAGYLFTIKPTGKKEYIRNKRKQVLNEIVTVMQDGEGRILIVREDLFTKSAILSSFGYANECLNALGTKFWEHHAIKLITILNNERKIAKGKNTRRKGATKAGNTSRKNPNAVST